MSVKLGCLEVLEACNSSAAKDVRFVLCSDTEIHRCSQNIMLFFKLNGRYSNNKPRNLQDVAEHLATVQHVLLRGKSD